MPSAAFENALPFVLRWEGGYVHHPADPGGATNRGITQAVYLEWLARQRRPPADVRDLTEADLQALYESLYWAPAGCARLPPPLDQVQFDTAVNMGVGRAVRLLQAAVGATVDGAFGPGTLQCVQAADAGATLVQYVALREAHYRDLVARKPELGVFLKGWLNRLNALRDLVGLPVQESADADGGAAQPRGIGAGLPAVDEATALRQRALLLREALAADATGAQQAEAVPLLQGLRRQRDWAALCGLAEALLRVAPEAFEARRLYAQALLETGAVVPAVALLGSMAVHLPPSHPEYGEAWGLLGRAHKQCFIDLEGTPAERRRQALAHAIAAYETPYLRRPQRFTWHGVNLLALVARARREGWPDIGARWQVGKLQRQLAQALERQPADEWTVVTQAEVALAAALDSGQVDGVEAALRTYLDAPTTSAFHVASTLRQFTGLWQLESLSERTPGHRLRGEGLARARHLVAMLRARLLGLPGARVELPPPGPLESVPKAQLEAVLGAEGPREFRWWLAGVEAARSVAVVRKRLGRRFGTGFLVRAGDLGLAGDADARLLLTNFHVVNPAGADNALRPADAEVVFEAHDANRAYAIRAVLWSSPVDEHDACLLQLDGLPDALRPLALASELPALPAPGAKKRPRVYVIGHPGGRELAVSMDDNELLDHEGPPAGKPANAAVCRVHYTAPTEGGNSGSPVFEDQAWRVIALHHAGGKLGMPRLNGVPGTYAANEGLAIGTLAAAAAVALAAPS